MITLLQLILCVLKQIPYFIVWAVVTAANVIIAGLGALLELLAVALPDMPDLPTVPSEVTDAMGWVAWILPVSTFVSILTFLVGFFILWWAISIGLRWAKATGD